MKVDKIILMSNPILLLHDLTLQNINKHVYKRDTTSISATRREGVF